MRTSKGYLFRVRESVTITHVLAETQRQAEVWESYIAEKRKGFRCPRLEAVVMEKLDVGRLEVRYPMRLVGVHIWLSFLGPKLEVGTKISRVVNY